MDDIAQEADMSRAAVYQYVRNKEDAFRRLTRRLLDEALASARVALECPGGLADRLTAALQTKLDLALGLWRDSPAHAAELLGDNARLSAELIDAYNAAMRDLLAGAVSTAHPVEAVESPNWSSLSPAAWRPTCPIPTPQPDGCASEWRCSSRA